MGVLSAGNHSGTYGEFAGRAALIQLDQEPAIKEPEEFVLIGTPVHRVDTPAKVTGAAKFGIDAMLPGMVFAAVKSVPVPGGSLKSFDFEAIRSMPGVIQAVALKRPADANHLNANALREGVAVVADTWYRAKTALDVMPIEWEFGEWSRFSNESLETEWRALLDLPGEPELTDTDGTLAANRFAYGEKINVGDAIGVIDASDKVVTADYVRPYSAHACMEPMNCTVSIANGRADVYTSSQTPDAAVRMVAGMTGIEIANVHVHVGYLGGGFGRRLANDYVAQATAIAMEVGRPVKLIWTREEDIMQNPMRPMGVARLKSALGDDGLPIALFARFVGEDDCRARQFCAYNLDHEYYDWHEKTSNLPVGSLRGTDSGLWGFAIESFTDELAIAADQDPLDFRIALTKHLPDWQVVLQILKEKSGYATDLPRGEGMGVAVSETHGTICAQCCTVSVSRRGQLRVEHFTTVVDSGNVVSPNIAVDQVNSCIAYELSHALRAGIQLRDGSVVNNNFDTYQVLRIHEMPTSEVILAMSGRNRWGGNSPPVALGASNNAAIEAYRAGLVTPARKDPRRAAFGWGGLGEPNSFATPPAVANAIYQATGKRIRSTPFSQHDLSWA
jgi:isoquinoline 1-oxidoreductase beta subunit